MARIFKGHKALHEANFTAAGSPLEAWHETLGEECVDRLESMGTSMVTIDVQINRYEAGDDVTEPSGVHHLRVAMQAHELLSAETFEYLVRWATRAGESTCEALDIDEYEDDFWYANNALIEIAEK